MGPAWLHLGAIWGSACTPTIYISMLPLLHGPRPGGMREAIKSAAPEGEHGVMKPCLRILRLLRLLTKSVPGRVFRRTSQHMPAYASLGHRIARTFSTTFVRHQRGIGTSPLLADKSLEQKCATSTRIRHFSPQCQLSADNSTEQNCATSTSETNLFLMLPAYVGSWQPSWPHDGLQDLQHEPSKAQDAPHSLPKRLPKPPNSPQNAS